MPFVLVFAIVFLAVFTQSVIGFGLALVAMALLPLVIDLRIAVPMVTLIAICVEIVLLLRYRHAFRFHAVARLSAAALVGIPIGLVALKHVDGAIILRVLGAVIAGYAVYALLNLRLPTIQRPQWAYGFGFASGILSGLYNTGGPPLVIYGTFRRWSPDEFRGNLQGIFVVSSVTTIIGHVLSQNYTPLVWQYFFAALPALVAGLLSGFFAARHINPVTFRKIVLVGLLLLGLRLLL
jgi:uncharacterized membrane protein YfcA